MNWHLLTAIGQGFDGCQGLSDGAFPAAHNIDVWAIKFKWLCIHLHIIRKVAQAANLCVQLLHDCVNELHSCLCGPFSTLP